MTSPYFSDTDSDSESSSDSDPEHDDDFDDAFSVDNMFDPDPQYPDSDDDEPNIFHDAYVIGVPSRHARIDLEIYEAYDEDEIKDLPEMELCIEGEVYEALFNTEEAVDVEIDGSQLICTGALFEEGEEMILDGLQNEEANLRDWEDGDVLTLDHSHGSSEDPNSPQGVSTQGGFSDAFPSSSSELPFATQQGDSDDTFPETEDGFIR